MVLLSVLAFAIQVTAVAGSDNIVLGDNAEHIVSIVNTGDMVSPDIIIIAEEIQFPSPGTQCITVSLPDHACDMCVTGNQCNIGSVNPSAGINFFMTYTTQLGGTTGDIVTTFRAEASAMLLDSDTAMTTVTQSADLATLTVGSVGSGDGVVSGTAPAGNMINCPGSCQQDFPKDGAVTLTATPDAMSSFSKWTGGVCKNNENPCTFFLTRDKKVRAKFKKN